MKTDLKALAERGAIVRLAQLDDERRAILALFPALRLTAMPSKLTMPPVRRHRKPMTTAQRLTVSKRMRAYWADRRKRGA